MKQCIGLSVISIQFSTFAVMSAVAGPNADADAFTAVVASTISGSPPWFRANPFAEAVAMAYSNASSEAFTIAHADPKVCALVASADDCASIRNHASCGLLIIEGQKCSAKKESSCSGPYDNTCFCPFETNLMKYYARCMSCGWTLWKFYGGYVFSASTM